ncbi:polyisoprenoid-binding protein YceI [Lewinella aquimaris]|uniref:Polyisoprenoid-binding protein YceI n=1 Tax=Neolewinella aquimaris TaxID=1835722 RepID=A0A840EEG7_9BACT|nr:YceI family protein [Neolewinella aquimaris]MBB4079336.1 polyisoprenoid-binding protein YceI [Neolewinella aquimaris]
MLKSILLLSAFALLTTADTVTVAVDTAASEIAWKAYKVTGNHTGTISIKEGQLEFTDTLLTGGSFTIDMPTIAVTDLSGDSKGRLEGHLKSDDFFGVENHPEATFVITNVVSRGLPGDYRITGDLTIKEHTKSIRFNTKVTETDGFYTAEADLTLDRTDFDVRYGSGSFIENLGDKTIYDEFELAVTLVTKQ